MKCILAPCLVIGLCIQSAFAMGADLDTGAYVSQVSGVTGQVMSMQDIMKPVMALTSQLPHMNVGQGNYSFVLQNGNFNNAAVVQSGARNAGFIAQTGYRNSAYLQQYGSNHQGFIIQSGIGNIASVRQR